MKRIAVLMMLLVAACQTVEGAPILDDDDKDGGPPDAAFDRARQLCNGCVPTPVCEADAENLCACACQLDTIDDRDGGTYRCAGQCWELIVDGGADADGDAGDAGTDG